ncbi:GNAT family N-acetyltransferase [Mucisphaera calidilacus]|uniref:Acetyltransferase (GNAT) family protein n=1 Tax=Mucisphaera calidilacus TaxID=2527982 RepID=A0A518BZ60_9BACT|nr:GNAT family N-acetyltransferase [Mucisphaera calidilacus]QDU72257.1 Acetyltransferase (GNAT) family protein [Mucisphaera calidilacus]
MPTHANSPTIRLGTPTDFPHIDRFDPFAGDRQIELAQNRVFVAVIDDLVIGYTTFTNPGFIGHPFINYLAVGQPHRRQGVATGLLHTATSHLGPARIFASTEDNNAEMLAFFDKEKWTHAGTIQGVNKDGSAECFFYYDIRQA